MDWLMDLSVNWCWDLGHHHLQMAVCLELVFSCPSCERWVLQASTPQFMTCFHLSATVKGTNPDVRWTGNLASQHLLQLLNFSKLTFLTGKMELIFLSTFLIFFFFFFGMDSTRYKNTSARYLMDVQEIFSILIFHVCKVIISSFFHFKSWKKIENGNEHDPKWQDGLEKWEIFISEVSTT